MYVLIYGERWAMDGQPAVTEAHGSLVSEGSEMVYGRVLTDEEQRAIEHLMLTLRAQLPFDPEAV